MPDNWLYGALNLPDTNRDTVNTAGQVVVWDAARAYLAQYNADLQEALSLLVADETEDHSFKYMLPGGGMAQQRGGQARNHLVKTTGEWKVELPLYDFGDDAGGDRIALSYMTLNAFQAHVETVRLRDLARVRFELLRSLFNNTARTFPDPRKGDLTVKPLANGDADLYPPTRGSSVVAAADHYAGTNSATITDTANPFKTAVRKLTDRFGAEQGNSNIVTFINPDETDATTDLAGFTEVPDRFIIPGVNTDTLTGLPTNLPGRVIGRTDGTWVSEWPDIPSGYLLSLHLAAPAPLLRRVDPAFTGLPRGLTLISRSGDDSLPFEVYSWSHRYGYGVGNRLNGYVQQLVASTDYTTPTIYE